MKQLKKNIVVAICCALGLLLSPLHGTASDWPKKPVTIIVCYAAGGAHDTIGRILAQGLEKELGVSVIVKNSSGAGGTIGAAEGAGASPDGYTFTLIAAGPAITQPQVRSLPYGVDAWALVALICRTPLCLQVGRESPYKTVDDFVKAAKTAPGTIVAATTGVGSSPHLAMVGFCRAFDVKLRHMPERSAAEIAKSLAGGTVKAMFEAEAYITRFETRGLLRFAPERSNDPDFKDIPCSADFGKDVVIYAWEGLAAPKGTPESIVNRMSDALGRIVNIPRTQQLLRQSSLIPAYMPRAEFEKFYREHAVMYANLLKEAGLVK